jgi:AbrB family looped-hinge helix DNA binding protein
MTYNNKMSYSSKMSSNGRIVIPADIRELLGLEDGSTVIFEIEGSKAFLSSRSFALKKLQDAVSAQIAADGSDARTIFDNFIAERRSVATKEATQLAATQHKPAAE